MQSKVRKRDWKIRNKNRQNMYSVKERRQILRGSYTVEMALLSGVWLLVIFASLLLILGTYAGVRDTAKAAEGAAYGSINGVPRQGEALSASSNRIDKENGFSVSGSSREITVSYSNTLAIPYGELKWKREGMIKTKVIRPVLFIEKVEKSRRFLENLTGQ